MIKKLGSVIIFIIFFFGAKYFLQYGISKYQNMKEINAVENLFSEIEKEASTYNSETPKSIAFQEIASRKAEENINSQRYSLKKRQTAISTFMGFYLINYRTRSIFCKNQGVDISTFSNKFKALHKTELSLSKELVFKKQSDIEKLYKILKPQADKIIEQDMLDLSKAYEVTLRGACELLEQNGVAFAKEMNLLKIQPSVYKAIHVAN